MTMQVPESPLPTVTAPVGSAAPLPSYWPERIWQARHCFFDQGQAPQGLVDEPVLRSWQRCLNLGRLTHEAVEFDPVDRGHLRSLLDSQQALLDAARPELASLAQSVADAGYAVLLTDAQGRALAIDGALNRQSKMVRQAFRPGVDLSEAVIGTSAMSAALSERRLVRVQGPEHFFADNQIFHCCAAPIFDPAGRVLGTVDISRDQPGLAAGAQALTLRCAQRIGQRLFLAQPARLRLRLLTEAGAQGDEAWLAFDESARLVAATTAALQLLDRPLLPPDLHFNDVFDERFSPLLQAGRSPSALLQLRGGVRLPSLVVTGNAMGAADTAWRAPASSWPHTPPAAAEQGLSPCPSHGDARLSARFAQALRALDADLPVLICGETGSGKEVAARALHAQSQRAQQPWVALNCGAISPQLMAAELFGHVEGAYTGARRGGQIGKIEAAHGGTLLLDEIGDMPLDLQVGLLRVLDSGEITRVGATRPTQVQVRILAASHRDLRALVAQGRFREDLYYRLSGFTLRIPALRERQDFDALADALLAQLGQPATRLPAAVRDVLRTQPWPGNVRQLRHALKVACVLAEPDQALTLDLFTDTLSPLTAAAPSAEASRVQDLSLKPQQEAAIAAALARTGGQVAQAAALLGMSRATLYRRLARQRQDERGTPAAAAQFSTHWSPW